MHTKAAFICYKYSTNSKIVKYYYLKNQLWNNRNKLHCKIIDQNKIKQKKYIFITFYNISVLHKHSLGEHERLILKTMKIYIYIFISKCCMLFQRLHPPFKKPILQRCQKTQKQITVWQKAPQSHLTKQQLQTVIFFLFFFLQRRSQDTFFSNLSGSRDICNMLNNLLRGKNTSKTKQVSTV